MHVVVLGLSHRSSPVTVRERFAFNPDQVAPALDRLRASGLASECVILSTCNRVELYAATESEPLSALRDMRRFLIDFHDFQGPLDREMYELHEPNSVEHLFKVVSGLDSMVLGETEILGQVKKAYQTALELKHTGARLNKVFQKAFNVAKHIRTHTSIQRGSVSVGSVAVELAEKIFSSLSARQVMVIGAGDTSEKTARALLSRGASSVIVSNRSYDRAAQLAAELGGRAVRFGEWKHEFDSIDIVISSTAAPHYVLDRYRLKELVAHRHRPLLLIDIAVPRDIDPEVNLMDEVFLYNIDDLNAIAADYLKQRREEIGHCEKVIREMSEGVLGGLRSRKPSGPGGKLAFG